MRTFLLQRIWNIARHTPGMPCSPGEASTGRSKCLRWIMTGHRRRRAPSRMIVPNGRRPSRRDALGKGLMKMDVRFWRKADVEVGSRGSEMDATDVRCPLPSCAVPKARCRRRGDRRIPQERSTALRISDGVRWAACPPDPLCATRAVPDESAASTRSRSIDLSVGAFAGLIRKIGSRQTRGRT